MKRRYVMEIARVVSVEIDEKKITKDVIEGFSEVMWKIEGIEEIIRHIANLVGIDDTPIHGDVFIEGLGEAKDFGVKALVEDESTELYTYHEHKL